jgi:fumarylacetoacetate (FAA) hydrolase family protein
MDGTLIGRIWDPEAQGPAVVTLREGRAVDITSRTAPLVRDICEMDDPAAYVQGTEGRDLGPLEELLAAPVGDLSVPHLLAPCDLQAVKACGVTFAGSMVERVIEERAAAIRPGPRRSAPAWAPPSATACATSAPARPRRWR